MRASNSPTLFPILNYDVTEAWEALKLELMSVLNFFPTKQINKHFPGESGEIHLLIYFPFSIATDDKRLAWVGASGTCPYLFSQTI